MKTIKEVSEISGLSIRALQHYDNIGLLKATERTKTDYRLYDMNSIEKLQKILLFKELEIPLKEIKIILDNEYDMNIIIDEQIEILNLKKKRLENLIIFAKKLKVKGENIMDFSVFDNKQIDDYVSRAKERWGNSKEYQEFDIKTKKLSEVSKKVIYDEFIQIFKEFGEFKNLDIKEMKVQEKVRKLQNYITEHFYKCSDNILLNLGEMYAFDGEFKDNINRIGGEGTAEFIKNSIVYYVSKNTIN